MLTLTHAYTLCVQCEQIRETSKPNEIDKLMAQFSYAEERENNHHHNKSLQNSTLGLIAIRLVE